jgi:hypothetical protein
VRMQPLSEFSRAQTLRYLCDNSVENAFCGRHILYSDKDGIESVLHRTDILWRTLSIPSLSEFCGEHFFVENTLYREHIL